jgi:hypothetical protein
MGFDRATHAAGVMPRKHKRRFFKSNEVLALAIVGTVVLLVILVLIFFANFGNSTVPTLH